MNPENHWKPNDWLRLISLVGAFLLFGLGAWMLFQGISAEGVVDLKSTVLSGTIKASSAGLYICFFALFIILFVLATLLTPTRSQADGKSRFGRALTLFWGILAALGLCLAASALTDGTVRSAFAVPIGVLLMLLVAVVTAMVRMAAQGDA